MKYVFELFFGDAFDTHFHFIPRLRCRSPSNCNARHDTIHATPRSLSHPSPTPNTRRVSKSTRRFCPMSTSTTPIWVSVYLYPLEFSFLHYSRFQPLTTCSPTMPICPIWVACRRCMRRHRIRLAARSARRAPRIPRCSSRMASQTPRHCRIVMGKWTILRETLICGLSWAMLVKRRKRLGKIYCYRDIVIFRVTYIICQSVVICRAIESGF